MKSRKIQNLMPLKILSLTAIILSGAVLAACGPSATESTTQSNDSDVSATRAQTTQSSESPGLNTATSEQSPEKATQSEITDSVANVKSKPISPVKKKVRKKKYSETDPDYDDISPKPPRFVKQVGAVNT